MKRRLPLLSSLSNVHDVHYVHGRLVGMGEVADLTGARSDGKIVVPSAREAYDVRARCRNRKFRLNHAHRPMCQFSSV